jgi:hypothetical protein
MTRTPARLTGALGLLLACVLFASALPAAAQTTCSLREAQQAYESGRFDAAERLAAVCTVAPDLAPDARIAAYRLLALALLRQDRLGEAQLAVVQILGLRPAYEPDKVLDPPIYLSLVSIVQSQFRQPRVVVRPIARIPPRRPTPDRTLVREAASGLDHLPPIPPTAAPLPSSRFRYRAPGLLAAEAWQETASYGGERGDPVSSPLDEIRVNGGAGAGAGLAVALSGAVGAGARLSVVSIETWSRPKGGPPLYEIVDEAATSTLGASLSVYGRLTVRPWGVVSPYVQGGARLTARRFNGATRIGYGPEAALGLEGVVAQRVALFGEFGAALILPDTALDGATASAGGDLLTGVRVGARLRLSGSR